MIETDVIGTEYVIRSEWYQRNLMTGAVVPSGQNIKIKRHTRLSTDGFITERFSRLGRRHRNRSVRFPRHSFSVILFGIPPRSFLPPILRFLDISFLRISVRFSTPRYFVPRIMDLLSYTDISSSVPGYPVPRYIVPLPIGYLVLRI